VDVAAAEPVAIDASGDDMLDEVIESAILTK
jgi:hypothetical protein